MAPASRTPRARTLPSGRPRPRYDQDSLLAVAAEVFTARGYDGTSMEHLSRASGLSKSSIYHHVDGKEQLLRLALERALDPLLASLDAEDVTTGRAVDRLHHLVRRDVRSSPTAFPTSRSCCACTATPRRSAGRSTSDGRFDRRVAQLVQEAIDEGDVRSDVNARTTARLMFGVVNSLRRVVPARS